MGVRSGVQRQWIKSAGFWIARLVAPVVYVVVLPALLVPSSATTRQVSINYDSFKAEVARGNVRSIVSTETLGDAIDGRTFTPIVGSESKDASTMFQTTRPNFDEPLLDGLLAGHRVSINPPGSIPPSWDVVVSSGFFSTLSAILSGFVFIAIIGILTIPPGGDFSKRPPQPLLALVQAFISLVLASFLFALLAGAGSSRGRFSPLIEGFCISWIFALGVVQTAVGIAWVLKVYRLTATVIAAGRWVVHLTIGLAAVSTAGILAESFYELSPERAFTDTIAWIATALPLLAVPFLLGSSWSRRWSTTRSHLLGVLTLPVLVAVVGLAAADQAITALPLNLHNNFSICFGACLFAVFVLGALFAAYEAAMPAVASSAGSVFADSVRTLRALYFSNGVYAPNFPVGGQDGGKGRRTRSDSMLRGRAPSHTEDS